MLMSLHVHNFALIEDTLIEFTPGFNVFTGETGAGKSILIDAFGIALGSRASVDYIRSGQDNCWVQAVFDITEQEKVQRLLEELGIDNQENTLFLYRKINKNGKSHSSVNGLQMPLGTLSRLAAELVDIHGQHENQELLRTGAALSLVDLYGQIPLLDTLSMYKTIYAAHLAAKAQWQELTAQKEESEALAHHLEDEIKEIKTLNPKEGEEEELRSAVSRLQNSEKLLETAGNVHFLLEGDGNNNQGVLDAIDEAKRLLQKVEKYDENMSKWRAVLETNWLLLEDVRQAVGDYLSTQLFDSGTLENMQSRLDELFKLKKKYGGTIENVLLRLEEDKKEYDNLSFLDKHLQEAAQKVKDLARQLTELADRLSSLRCEAGEALSKLVTFHIQDLAMQEGRFETKVTPKEEYTLLGKDNIEFLFSANAGIEPKPLQKIASGGELSRLALAIKTVLMEKSGAATMVFDEIDTGIGGVTAQKMAEKIAIISQRHQVLCVTHLPQIACYAANHLHIIKHTDGASTHTEVLKAVGEERIEEIRRMISGDNSTALAKANAEELLILAQKTKERLVKKDENNT